MTQDCTRRFVLTFLLLFGLLSALSVEAQELRSDALRTPDERFANLDGWDFDPNYEVIDGYRIHYVDEGPRDGEVLLLMHGEPTWSYLYRKMIPVLNEAGFRTIAPDLLGFGRSDKPKSMDTHTYAFHVAAITGLVKALDLQNATFFGQDWGGLIGLRVVAENPERFARVVISNTGLPTGDAPLTDAFMNWKAMNQQMIERGDIPTGAMLARSTGDAAVAAAYEAPFPDASYKAGALVLPQRVPVTPDDPARAANLAAWEVYRRWEKPFLTAFGDSDPVTAGWDQQFQEEIPGAQGQKHVVVEGATHFIQESHGPQLAKILVQFAKDNPLP